MQNMAGTGILQAIIDKSLSQQAQEMQTRIRASLVEAGLDAQLVKLVSVKLSRAEGGEIVFNFEATGIVIAQGAEKVLAKKLAVFAEEAGLDKANISTKLELKFERTMLPVIENALAKAFPAKIDELAM